MLVGMLHPLEAEREILFDMVLAIGGLTTAGYLVVRVRDGGNLLLTFPGSGTGRLEFS